eukprot:scaffold16982_cov91-Skeletonema_dohrnii-CCMP3373.AAC.7
MLRMLIAPMSSSIPSYVVTLTNWGELTATPSYNYNHDAVKNWDTSLRRKDKILGSDKYLCHCCEQWLQAGKYSCPDNTLWDSHGQKAKQPAESEGNATIPGRSIQGDS